MLAHMMEFHRREDKAAWWEYFRLRDLEEHELADERRALAGLEFKEVLEAKKAPLQRYSFPPQELDAREGDERLRCAGREGRHGRGRQPRRAHDRHQEDARRPRTSIRTRCSSTTACRRTTLRKSLMRLGEAVIANGFATGEPWRAAIDLLLRRPPPRRRGERRVCSEPDETTVEAACRIALELDGNVLAIQGPPGTGKTYTGAHVICALVRAGLKVGVTAVSHKVIVNLLEGGREAGARAGASPGRRPLRRGRVRRRRGASSAPRTTTRSARDSTDGSINVVGGTAWCWARPDFEQSVDVLIVDEAGQMSLANVLATAQAARSLVLLGDPQQLEQPLQSSHPEGSEVSALYHVLDGEDTIPADKGLFLAETWRLHPDIAKFTSEVYYEGKVASRPGLERQAILTRERGSDAHVRQCAGSGLRYVPVPHTGQSCAVGGGGRDDPRARRSPAEPVQLARQGRCRASARRATTS